MKLPIAVDAMGGDRAPEEIMAGARRAADELGIDVVVVGPEDLDTRGLPRIAASEVIGMGDDPAAGVRRKKDATLVRAAEAVRDGKASAMVSAGNTGAAMASALLRMGRIKGVSRPAIATVLPVPGSTRATVLLDSGANAECQPEWLVQFAQMGSVFARHRFGLPQPNVGLLSIGEENSKGNTLVKETNTLLASAPGVHFIGNVEGRDILTDDVDIVVTDGFSGNIVLKALEGALSSIVGAVVEALTATDELARHFEVVRPAIDDLYERLEPESFGGAMLLGVNGVCIVSHGSSSAKAVVNAIKMAAEMVDEEVVAELRAAVTAD
ncbi:MAG TPA: phosphate acyltransferase PlsX [Acidimicrobiales bacterium]|nr:phosphate acyltransferase PlsX [Acidimicrobiales bacterium]